MGLEVVSISIVFEFKKVVSLEMLLAVLCKNIFPEVSCKDFFSCIGRIRVLILKDEMFIDGLTEIVATTEMHGSVPVNPSRKVELSKTKPAGSLLMLIASASSSWLILISKSTVTASTESTGAAWTMTSPAV